MSCLQWLLTLPQFKLKGINDSFAVNMQGFYQKAKDLFFG